jgi:hypothetical protein
MPEARCEAGWPHDTGRRELVCHTEARQGLSGPVSWDIDMGARWLCRPSINVALGVCRWTEHTGAERLS